MAKGELAHLALPGAEIAVRVAPGASRNAVTLAEGGLRVQVTQVAEGGKATEAVRKAVAQALGIAPSRLVLVRGATSKDKLFRVEP